uniref:Choline transporter-like protein n=1 Tax=Steinernema glaseri TaxID=37863 RepID=A0A1I7YY55_9BILA
MPTTWMVFGIIISILLAITLIIVCFIRSRIHLATKMIAETSKALNSMTSTLFFPLVPFLMQMVVFVVWASITIWLATSGEENCRRKLGMEPIENGEPCDCGSLGVDANCHYVNLTKDSNRIMGLQAYNLFGFFWLTCFVSGLAQTTLAGAFASYYWAFKKPRDVPNFPVLRSMGRAIRYNLGSIAFGSLVLAIVRFIRAILDFLQKRLVGAENVVLKFLYRALSCFFYILETVLKFLTKRAYIMMAIYGKGFCRSARDSFSLVTRNIVRVVVLDRVTTFLLFLGKATITLGMGAVAFIYFSGRWDVHPIPRVDLYYYFVPVIVVLIGSYYICDTFFDVYEMGVNTIFMCFLEDSESNDGSAQRPFYMSEPLKKILGKQNQVTNTP